MVYIKLLFEMHLFLLVLLFVIYLFEKISGIGLIFGWYNHKKDKRAARGSADFESILYLIYCTCFSVYKIYFKNTASKDINFWYLLLIIIVLTIFVNKMYYKFTAKDSEQDDFDFLD